MTEPLASAVAPAKTQRRELRSVVIPNALAMVVAGTAFARDLKGGTAGDPAPDAKRSGVVNEEPGERPRDEMSPHANYRTQRRGSTMRPSMRRSAG